MSTAHFYNSPSSPHKHYRDYLDLRGDGTVVIYRRGDTDGPHWWTRLKIPSTKGYVVKSLRTKDLSLARQAAQTLFYKLEGRVARGEKIRTPAFKHVFQQWKELATLHQTRYMRGNVRRMELWALPFFRDRQIDTISEPILLEYRIWRIRSAPKPPASSTLRNEWNLLKQILELARQQGYIQAIPKLRLKAVKPVPRPDISEREWQKLLEFVPGTGAR
jgi:integrase